MGKRAASCPRCEYFCTGFIGQVEVTRYEICMEVRFKDMRDGKTIGACKIDILPGIAAWVNDRACSVPGNDVGTVGYSGDKELLDYHTVL